MMGVPSRSDPKHGWYVWNDGVKDASGRVHPPNNWISLFGVRQS
jgi:hypothetical protein